MKLLDLLDQAQRQSDNERGTKDMTNYPKNDGYTPRASYKPNMRRTIQRAPGHHGYSKLEHFAQCLLIAGIVAGLVCLFYFSINPTK